MADNGILTVMAVGAAALAASGAAFGVARVLRLGRLFRATGDVTPLSPGAMVDRLAGLADVAKSQGLLSAESHADPAIEPLVSQGIAWAVEGRSVAEIRDSLDQALESAGAGRGGLARLAAALGAWRSVLVIVGVLPLLLFVDLNLGEPAKASGGIALISLLAFFAATAAAASVPLAGRTSEPARLLWGILQVATVGLIRSGHDGAATRQALTAMLPASVRQTAAKAA